MPGLELALVELGGHRLPADASSRRASASGSRRRPAASCSLPARRTLLIALALLAVAVGALMAVPGTRAAILEFFHVRGVAIEQVEELPTVPVDKDFNRGRAGQPRRGADELAELRGRRPRGARRSGRRLLPGLSARRDGRLRLRHAREAAGPVHAVPRVRRPFFKKVAAGTQIRPVKSRGAGLFPSGEPHVFAYFDAERDIPGGTPAPRGQRPAVGARAADPAPRRTFPSRRRSGSPVPFLNTSFNRILGDNRRACREYEGRL